MSNYKWRSAGAAALVAVVAAGCGSGGTVVANEPTGDPDGARTPVESSPPTRGETLTWDAAPGLTAKLSVPGVSMVGEPYEYTGPEIVDVAARITAAELSYRTAGERPTESDRAAFIAELGKLPTEAVTSRGVRLTSGAVPGPVFVVTAQAPFYTAEEIAVHGERSRSCQVVEVRGVPALRCGEGTTRTLSWQHTPDLSVFVAADDAFDGREVDGATAAEFERLVEVIAESLVLDQR